MSASYVVARAARSMKPWPIRGVGLGQSTASSIALAPLDPLGAAAALYPLGSLFSSSPLPPPTGINASQAGLQNALAAAKKNGVDTGAIQQLYNSGADDVQLMLAATRGVGTTTLQSQLDTINESVGASNYVGQSGVSPTGTVGTTYAITPPSPPPTAGTSWLSSNWPWLVGGGVAAIAAAYLLGKLL